jgi:hypothetical protein
MAIAAVLKTAVRKDLGVRIPRPPLRAVARKYPLPDFMTIAVPTIRRAAALVALLAAVACRSEGSADADSSAAVVSRSSDSVAPPAPARDVAVPPTPTGPSGIYSGSAGAGQEVMITLYPGGQYLMLIRKPAGGTMSQGRYRVLGDSVYMVPAQSAGDEGLMIAVLRGEALTVNPSTSPTVLMRRRGAEVGSGVAPPPGPR